MVKIYVNGKESTREDLMRYEIKYEEVKKIFEGKLRREEKAS